MNNPSTFSLSDKTARRLLDEAHDGIVVSDPALPDNPLVYVNQAFLNMSGYNRDEIIGKNCRFLQQGNSKQESVDKLRIAIKQEEPIVVDLINYRKDGTEFYNELSVSPIYDENNKLIYFLGVQKDVTIEVERNKARDDFVSLVSHQLKSSPNAINWLTENLEDTDNITQEQRSIINDIKLASQNMTDTINSLLNITRVQLGTYISAPEPISLSDVVSTLIDGLQESINKKQLSLSAEKENLDIKITADPSMLRIVIETLLSNAVKYTTDNGTVTITAKSSSNDKIMITVKDSGIGIPKEEQTHLFQKMYRASNAKDIDGTGLGLYTLGMILVAMQGTVKLESSPESGTTFFVELPTVAEAHTGTSFLHSNQQ